jgi:predicted phosphodiesterase
MSKKVLIIILVFILGIMGALITYLWTFRKTDLSVSSKNTDFEISAGELLQHFENDEVSANETFVDKVIIVKGPVDTVSEDSLTITVYLKEEDAVSGVLCSFDKSVISAEGLNKGNVVRIKGICSGYLMDVILNRCSLEE